METQLPTTPNPPKKRSGTGAIISLAVFILAALGIIVFLYNQNQSLKKKLAEYQTTPVVLNTPTPKPTASEATPSATGTVSGKLCFPSDFLPPGEIIAKDLDSEQIYTQDYLGSQKGGKSTYAFELPTGTYHLRYQAHGSTQEPEIFTSGYFDECAKTMHVDQCTPDEGHVNIDVKVGAGEETKNIDLCDFYYTQTQEEFLDKDF